MPRRPLSLAESCLLVHRFCLLLVLLLVPIFFLPFTVEILEVNKQTLLVGLTLVSLLAWLGSLIAARRFSYRQGWLNILPPFLLAGVLVSTIRSPDAFLSLVGESSQQYTSFLSFAAYITLFYLFVQASGETWFRRWAAACLLVSGFVAGTIGLLSAVQIYLPFDFAQSSTFNTIGTVNALGVFLAAVAVLACGLWLIRDRAPEMIASGGGRPVEMTLAVLVMLEGFLYLVLLDEWSLWVAFLGGLLVLFAVAMIRSKDFPNTNRFVLPMVLFVVGLLLVFIQSPLRANIPTEVTPSFSLSWDIAKDGFTHGSLLFGTGPGSFVFDYARLRPAALNTTDFWNVRFDRAASDLLNVLITLGATSLLAFLLFVFALAWKSIGTVLGKREEWHAGFAFLGAWITIAISLAVYSSDLTIAAIFFSLAGILGAAALRPGKERRFADAPRLGLLATGLFMIVSVGIVTVIFIAGRQYAAEIAFAQGVRLSRAGGDTQQVVDALDRAATINRFNDVYYRNLSQALLLRVGTEIAQLKTGQATDDQRSMLQALTAASINAGVTATNLSPDNVLNWVSRGDVYRQLAPIVDTAGAFSIQAFQKAIELEPANPQNQTELGKTYLVLADQERTYASSDDATVKADHAAKLTDDLTSAENAFQAAIALKSDYSPAHYELAIAYDEEGRLDDAIGKMESIEKYNPLDVGVAFQLGSMYLQRNGTGDLAKAQTQFEAAIKLVPSYSDAHWFLSSVYEKEGNVQGALTETQKVLDLNPDNETVKSRLSQLQAGQSPAAPVQPVDVAPAN